MATAEDGLPAYGLPWPAFMAVIFVLGFFMSLGKAAVYKHIPVYYPDTVGAVGGVVGLIGGLGGFVLPMAFGALLDLTGVWTSCFMLMFVIVATSFLWMHAAIVRMERRRYPDLGRADVVPELAEGVTANPVPASAGTPIPQGRTA